MTSRERIRILLEGKLPDRPPLYDVIRNDAVIEHFSGGKLNRKTAASLVPLAHERALDATKSFFRLPNFQAGTTEVTKDGRKVTHQKWTSWCDHRVYASAEEYAEAKKALTAEPCVWCDEDQERLTEVIARWQALQRQYPALCQDLEFPGPARLDNIFSEVGLEAFSYYMVDCPDVLHRQVHFHFEKITQAVEAADLPEEALLISEAADMAFKTGLLFPPAFLRKSFIPGYTRFCDAVHRKGRKVLFHSDGNLTEILDDLVEAGIDLLHPLEPLAGMDPGEIHRRYPHLILLGSIDVSQLLPYGTEEQIADRVKRNIEAAEGMIMIGSSTEVHNEVPLRNYLALHEAVLDYRYG